MSQDSHAARPFGRSLGDFGELSPAERKLLDAVGRGGVAEIGQVWPEKRTDENSVRAQFIRFLALGGAAAPTVPDVGVLLQGAAIKGVLNLACGVTVGRLWLIHCYFDSVPVFDDLAVRGSIILSGSHLPGLQANRIVVSDSLIFDKGFVCEGNASLMRAKIGGNLRFIDARFVNPDGSALSAHGIDVGGNVFMSNGFEARGCVYFSDAKIANSWSCASGVFSNVGGEALNATGLRVVGNVLMGNGFKADGQVNFIGAKIQGSLICGGGTFSAPGDIALLAVGSRIGALLTMDADFRADGEVRISQSKIGIQWRCNGGSFSNPGGDALTADEIDVGSDAVLADGFVALGNVRLIAAKIRGDLQCQNGSFENLYFQRLVVDSTFYFNNVRRVSGSMSLARACAGALVDDLKSWPVGRLVLAGFVFGTFGDNAPVSGKERIQWLVL